MKILIVGWLTHRFGTYGTCLREEAQWLRLQGQKELEAHALQEQRRLREQEERQAEELREKHAADLAKASRLCGRIFRHKQWIAFWEWARAAAAAGNGGGGGGGGGRPAIARWIFREETTERLLADIRAAPRGAPLLAGCLGEAAAHGLLGPMREALAKVMGCRRSDPRL